jgi:hypothetical protein
MKRVLLITPPQTQGGRTLENHTLLWLASFLRRRGHTAKLLHLRGPGFRETLARTMKDFQPEYALVCGRWYTNLYGSIHVASLIRNLCKDTVLGTGGVTASVFHQELIERNIFDFVVRGDAEVPLEKILTGHEAPNTTWHTDGGLRSTPTAYLQRQDDLCGLTLVEPETILEDPGRDLHRENFIWTGKGCRFNCLFCSGAASCQRRLSGRRQAIVRPVGDVVHDIDILTRYSSVIFFDFSDKELEAEYYPAVFSDLAHKDLFCHFAAWSLPARSFVARVSRAFRRVQIDIDVSTMSENLRGMLAAKGWIKPSFGNTQLDELLAYCTRRGNVSVGLYAIAGLPGETEADVEEHLREAQRMVDRHRSVVQFECRPLSVEPGSPLHESPGKWDMELHRHSFDDFLSLGRAAFTCDVPYPYAEFLEKEHLSFPEAVKHPFGVCQRGRSEVEILQQVRRSEAQIRQSLELNRECSQLFETENCA